MYRRMVFAMSVLIGVLVVGTAGYVTIEGWSIFDALYMTVITVGTIGYGETHPLTQAGRAFTMLIIFAGFGAMFLFVGTVVDFIFEGHLRDLVEGRRMKRVIASLDGHTIVAGMGRVGSVVVRSLAEESVPFIIIDHSREAIDHADENGWPVLDADATDQETLIAAGVEKAKSLVSTLDTDADNLFVTFSARTLNPELFIVARSTHESNEERLRQAGANRVITPNEVSGRRMATMVMHPVVSDYLDIVTHGDDVEFRLQEVSVPSSGALAGKTIRDACIRDVTGAYVLAIQSPNGRINTNPPADAVMNASDKLVVLGTEEQLKALERAL